MATFIGLAILASIIFIGVVVDGFVVARSPKKPPPPRTPVTPQMEEELLHTSPREWVEEAQRKFKS